MRPCTVSGGRNRSSAAARRWWDRSSGMSPTAPGRTAIGDEPLRRRRHRRRPQRPGRRGPAGQGRAAGRRARAHATRSAGAAITETPWGPDYKMTALSYVVSLMPPTILRELELERHGYQIYPQGPYFVPYAGRPAPAAPRRPRGPRTRRSPSSRPRRGRHGGAGTPGSARLADVLGPLLIAGAAQARLEAAGRPARPRPAWAGGSASVDVRDGRRRHPAVHVEHRRPARRLLRVPADEGRARGERRHRHVGRPAVAGHRLRDGPPQDRRRRRGGQIGAWGFPEGGMGGGDRGAARAAASLRREVRTEAAGRPHRRRRRPR